MNEKQAVINTIEEGYLQHWMIEPNVEEMQKAFHPDANVYVISDGSVITFNQDALNEYVGSLETAKEEITWEFNQIDLIKNMAMVKLSVYRDGALSVVDIFNLYKTNDGWKIIAKLFESF